MPGGHRSFAAAPTFGLPRRTKFKVEKEGTLWLHWQPEHPERKELSLHTTAPAHRKRSPGLETHPKAGNHSGSRFRSTPLDFRKPPNPGHPPSGAGGPW